MFLPTEISLQPPCLISKDCVKVNQVNDMVEDMESKSERVRSEEKENHRSNYEKNEWLRSV